jgi:hypothetical protein
MEQPKTVGASLEPLRTSQSWADGFFFWYEPHQLHKPSVLSYYKNWDVHIGHQLKCEAQGDQCVQEEVWHIVRWGSECEFSQKSEKTATFGKLCYVKRADTPKCSRHTFISGNDNNEWSWLRRKLPVSLSQADTDDSIWTGHISIFSY